jgi:EmrB/QacA subfamily drug resistance transporter
MKPQQRLALAISILASFVAFLDGSVINVALPAIAHNLGGGLATQQWVVDAYLITLGSLMLIAGSFSDIFGRKRIMNIGLIGFGAASLLCAVAPSNEFLIVSRALQGIAGAFLVPSSLALIIATFRGAAQGKAIGTWTAWTGIAFIIGPLLGGAMVDALSWRLIFGINVLPILITLWLLTKLEVRDVRQEVKVDFLGAGLCALGLGLPVYSLIEQPHYGWGSPRIYLPLLIGVLAFGLFLWHEHRTNHPMLPLNLFRVRNFSFGNLATLFIYASLSIATFVIAVFVQQTEKFTATEAGLALIPITLIMFFLSPRIGALSGKYGPRLFMTFGPIVCGIGFLTMLTAGRSFNYWLNLFPGIVIFGIGLSLTVAPLTSAVLGSIDSKQAGIGSAINNAVARIAGLLGVAFIGVIVASRINIDGFHRGILVMAALMLLGGTVSFIGIRKPAMVED